MVRTIRRCPTAMDSEPLYRMAAVPMQMNAAHAVAQCTARETPPKRARSPDARSAGRLIVAAVGAAHPRVDVVPALLPVTLDHPVGDLDPRQPLGALVAVHRRHVEPDRAAVG